MAYDILDHNPVILQADYSGRLQRIASSGGRLLALGLFAAILGRRYLDILWYVFTSNAILGQLFALLVTYIFVRIFLDFLLKLVWDFFGREQIILNPGTLVLKRSLFFTWERSIPLSDIEKAHWQYHGYSCHEWDIKFWQAIPFHFGKCLLFLKNGKKLYFGSQIPLSEFKKLATGIPIAHGRNLIKF